MKNLKKMSIAVLLATTVVGQTFSNPAAIKTAAVVLAPMVGAGAAAYGATQLKGVAVQATAPVAEAAVEAVAETVVPAVVDAVVENGSQVAEVAQEAAEKVVEATTSWTAKLNDGCSWVGAQMQALWNSEKVQNVVNAEATQKAVAWACDNKEAIVVGTVAAALLGYCLFAKDAPEQKAQDEQEAQEGDFAPGFEVSETPELKVVL